MSFEIIKGTQPSAIKAIVYGPEGIGKSTFASRLPDPLFIDTEGSTKYLNVNRLPAPENWEVLLREIQYVRETPGICKALVIDTADWAERLCISYVCNKKGWSGIEDPGYGKGFTYLAEEFDKLLRALEEVIHKDIHVVLTAHATMRKFEQPDEMGAYDRWELKLQKKTAPMLKEWADMVLFANYKTVAIKASNGTVKGQGGKRVMYTTHHPCWDAKNRYGLPDEMEFDYFGIAHLFKSPQAGKEEVKLATPPQEPSPELQLNDHAEPQIHTVDTSENEKPYEGDWEGIPERLLVLMKKNKVTPIEIQSVVASKKKYYTQVTPIRDYRQDFIDNVLIAAWDKVFAEIKSERELPF